MNDWLGARYAAEAENAIAWSVDVLSDSRPTRGAPRERPPLRNTNARSPTCVPRHVLAGSEPTRGAPATVGNDGTADLTCAAAGAKELECCVAPEALRWMTAPNAGVKPTRNARIGS